MRTKNIFKTVALAMMMPAMLLTTACSNEDDALNNTANTENTINKGYALPVTVNVTRGDDGATRATYNESTRKLEFSEGDQLFVEGSNIEADRFAGTLTWQSGGTFSGTIYTESPYEGTIDDLLDGNYATLLPAGYKSYDYLEIIEDENEYEAHLGENAFNSFATSKKLGVEQLSYETGSYTSGTGFVLEPRNAILNFTITGLTPSTKVTATLSDGDPLSNIEGEVTTDGSGTATFAIGLEDGSDLNDFSLTVAGNAITLVNESKTLEAGKIYNITRAAAPAPVAAPFSVSSTKQVYFAPGNLRAKYKDGTWTWSFSPNQWSYVGNASNNTNINGNGTVSAGGELYVDLFGWVGNSSTVLTGAIAKYGISNSTTSSDYSTVAGEALKSDWSVVANAANLDGHNDWRTLTGGDSGEWKYLLETRSASTVSGTANARYCKATVNSVPGLVIFPDSYTHPTGVTAPTNINYVPARFNSNSWSGGDWTAMETVGCVFLPAAGYRSGASVSEVGTEGWYWSSTSHAEDAGWAGRLYFWKGDVNGWANKQVYRGHSVRLVRDAN
jgi:hypothetical protein